MTTEKFSLKIVRQNCLECSGGSTAYLIWRPNDGVHSTLCRFWSFRFGQRPATFRQKYGTGC